MIIDDEIIDLVSAIAFLSEKSTESGISSRNLNQINLYITRLVNCLDINCRKSDPHDFMSQESNVSNPLSRYPVDDDGFAVGYDPITQESDFRHAWHQHGLVVGKDILSSKECEKTIIRINQMFDALGIDVSDDHRLLGDLRDEGGTSVLSRGFFEIYHDHSLSQIRQNIRNYIHHVLIWHSAQLWTSFDRFGVKFPHNAESKGLPLHVDQNAVLNPDFTTVQGVLALRDCPLERGTFRAVPGSKNLFNHYAGMMTQGKEYSALDITSDIGKQMEKAAQNLPIRQGHLVSWDSRTTHANTPNVSDDIRYVAYIAAGLAQENNQQAIMARRDVIQTGAASSRIKTPDALIRASLKPRYTAPTVLQAIRKDDALTMLGRLLYGVEKYDTLLKDKKHALTP